MNNNVRVRFAPAPTGLMHLGNVRTALMNYLFARKKEGSFVLRLEDTDPDRNFDPNGKQIIKDLQWLGLSYQEGPDIQGPYAPYQQSLRSNLYQDQLENLQKNEHVYRCFCSNEELERKRERQKALKQPPRYDRTCLKLSTQTIEHNLSEGKPFVWRFKVPLKGSVTINELARGAMTFELQNFSDFPVTRSDATFTFIFANAVDDMAMDITYVLRGEDHLSNTVHQALLIQAMGGELPTYWHLPILCNVDGKKLSKRDFGFSLNDLRTEGYLPEAIVNYLAIIGGSFAQEIMSGEELIAAMNFDTIKTTGGIKYDVDKLKWLNHKWIERLEPTQLLTLLKPLIVGAYPDAASLSDDFLLKLTQVVKSELTTLNDIVPTLNFFFTDSIVTKDTIKEHVATAMQGPLFASLNDHGPLLSEPEQFMQAVKKDAKEAGIPNKILFSTVRLILTGSEHGPSLVDIMKLLGEEKVRNRIEKIIN